MTYSSSSSWSLLRSKVINLSFVDQELSSDVFTYVVAPWERRPRLATNQIDGMSDWPNSVSVQNFRIGVSRNNTFLFLRNECQISKRVRISTIVQNKFCLHTELEIAHYRKFIHFFRSCIRNVLFRERPIRKFRTDTELGQSLITWFFFVPDLSHARHKSNKDGNNNSKKGSDNGAWSGR